MAEHFAEWVAGLGPGVANHLWQSTACVIAAWFVTLALKKNQARVRYAVWLAASMKFLIPLSLLMAAGNLLPHPKQAVAPVVYSAMDAVEEPFADVVPVAPVIHVVTMRERVEAAAPAGLFVLWMLGVGFVMLRWAHGWRSVRRTLRGAVVVNEGREWEILRRVDSPSHVSESRRGAPAQIELRLSAERMEPGIFGVGRPVLVWPRELSARLDDEHIEAIMAHELAHVRRRDNLTAALHMVVETVFWFHPLVWWMERQMVKEREQACDEAVVAMGGDEEIYAESLLKTCRFCIESPLVCVAGVTGADLKQRVVEIVTGRALLQMSWAKKMLLGAAAVCVVAAPVVLGQAKAAQRLMLAAINAVPKPVQAAAKAMMAEASSEAAEAEQPTAPADNTVPTDADMALGPEFEVATIRPADPNEKNGGGRVTPSGRFEGRNMTVQSLVGYAYTRWQSYGGEQVATVGPAWIGKDRFDVEAKLSEEEMAGWGRMSNFQRTEHVRPMLRRLLTDRFHVQVRTEQRVTQVYALVVAKSGLKLKEVAQPGGSQELSETEVQQRMQDVAAHKAAPFPESFTMTGDSWSGTSLPLGILAMEIAANAHLDAPLVDRTGLNGYYDFGMKVSYEKDAPPLLDQIEQQLGLKAEPKKIPLTYYVITSAEKPSVDGAEVGAEQTGAPPQSIAASSAIAQEKMGLTKDNLLRFEAATVKPSDPNVRVPVEVKVYPGGRVGIHSQTIVGLIFIAFRLPGWRVAGVQDWMDQAHYSIEAVAPEAMRSQMTDAQTTWYDIKDPRLRQMVQALLIDRFGLRFHMESKTGKVYLLERSDKPLQLKPVKVSPEQDEKQSSNPPFAENIGAVGGRGWFLINASTDALAQHLSGTLKAPVLNRTGLDGYYNFDSKFLLTDDDFQSPATMDETFLSAVKEMGFKLTQTTGSVETLVIDHIEMPKEN